MCAFPIFLVNGSNFSCDSSWKPVSQLNKDILETTVTNAGLLPESFITAVIEQLLFERGLNRLLFSIKLIRFCLN